MLFLIRLFDFLFGDKERIHLGFLPDDYNTLNKYKVTSYINDFIINNKCPSKYQWKNIITHSMYSITNAKWKADNCAKPKLYRYSTVHSSIGLNPVLNLCKNATNAWHIVELVKLSIDFEREEVNCKLCHQDCMDVSYHFMMECPMLNKSRSKMLNIIATHLDSPSYTDFLKLSNDEKCCSLLGSKQFLNVSDETWQELMLALATLVHYIFVEVASLI